MSFNHIYQEKALQKLRKPEKRGWAFSITTGTGWMALAAVVILIFSGLVWAFCGVMADQVVGYGMIVDDSGVANISPVSSGRIVEMKMKPGDMVSAGQVVAVIEQPDLEQQLNLEVEQARAATSAESKQSRTAQLTSTKERYQQGIQVVSPHDGTIVSQRLRPGDIAVAGAPLYDIDVRQSQDLLGIMYVPALVGDKIKPGMVMNIAPGSIDSSLYGSLVGTVREISRFPVTSERINYWTGNKEFASWVVQKCGGTIMEVRVELTRDDETKSGYLWTTLLGPDEEIHEGMTCTATAIVDRKAPAAYAFDKLGQWLRTD